MPLAGFGASAAARDGSGEIAFLRLAMIRLMLRRLTRSNQSS
jgi:hypothetical protein